ncbi:hypothetical protein N7540_004275 [Penicillium herquei]|nr:hypothetical protein N7540_004275 [Penicillium herquei]
MSAKSAIPFRACWAALGMSHPNRDDDRDTFINVIEEIEEAEGFLEHKTPASQDAFRNAILARKSDLPGGILIARMTFGNKQMKDVIKLWNQYRTSRSNMLKQYFDMEEDDIADIKKTPEWKIVRESILLSPIAKAEKKAIDALMAVAAAPGGAAPGPAAPATAPAVAPVPVAAPAPEAGPAPLAAAEDEGKFSHNSDNVVLNAPVTLAVMREEPLYLALNLSDFLHRPGTDDGGSAGDIPDVDADYKSFDDIWLNGEGIRLDWARQYFIDQEYLTEEGSIWWSHLPVHALNMEAAENKTLIDRDEGFPVIVRQSYDTHFPWFCGPRNNERGWAVEAVEPAGEVEWGEWLEEGEQGESRPPSRHSSEERSPKRRRGPEEGPFNVPAESYKMGPAEHINSVSSILRKIKIHSFDSQDKGRSKGSSKKGKKKSKSSKDKGVVKRRKNKHRTKEKLSSD